MPIVADQLIEGLTFDDVLLRPGRSEVLPGRRRCPHEADPVDLAQPADRRLGHGHRHRGRMAIAMAQAGGIGVIHRNLEPEAQADQVRLVKKYESGMVVNPVTIHPDETLADALAHDEAPRHLRHPGGRARADAAASWSAS